MTRFDTFFPCEQLSPFVHSYALSEAGEAQTYKVLPGTGLVIGFQYRGRLWQVHDGTQARLERAGITGLQDRYRLFANEAGTGTVLVYFREAGAAAFFREPVHELFGESVSLEQFMLRSELLILEEKLAGAATDTGKIDVVEQFLAGRLRQRAGDPLVMAALSLIHRSKGAIRISELAVQLHTSQSPLEKRFRQAVGASPKKFASIVRFKHTLQQYGAQTSLTRLGYEAGFYDQAHFIREFKNFTGETPAAFFRSG